MRSSRRSRQLTSCVFFSTLAIASACGSPHQASQTKVVNGEVVAEGDAVARSTVALLTVRGQQFCTGTLLDKRHVLSAAHCAEGAPGKFYVAFGPDAKLGDVDNDHVVVGSRFKANSAFDRAAASRGVGNRPVNDISLVTLAADAPADFSPVPMLSANDDLAVGQQVIVAGYGITSAGANGTNGILRQTTSEVVQVAPAGEEFVLGNSEGRACNGDSGGPAYVNVNGQLAVAGIVSRGENGCRGTVIYTDVRYFLDWLNAQ